MNIEDIREYCISKTGVTEEFPFDESTLVFKVMGKMFLLSGLNAENLSFNAKCDPEKAQALRQIHSGIRPGYHMNKQHWNTVDLDGSISTDLIRELIDDSYDLIVSSLTKAKKEEWSILQNNDET